mgnify:CR=1 FL=1
MAALWRLASYQPRVCATQAPLGGRIKSAPEDFVVEELPAVTPCGFGEHLVLWLEKRDVPADRLVGRLAHALQVPPRSIGMAGRKDTRAVARQHISVPASAADAVARLHLEGVRILSAQRHTHKLRTGQLHGNRFTIRVRALPPEAAAQATAMAELLRTRGLPNYFGLQRFGHEGNTLRQGVAMLRENERPRRGRLAQLAASALQSALFNGVVARRVETGTLMQPIAGDLLLEPGSDTLFWWEEANADRPTGPVAAAAAPVPTGPLWGPKMRRPRGAAATLEQAVLHASGLGEADFDALRKLAPGARRPVAVQPRGLTVEPDADAITVRVTLPAGVYATVLLAELFGALG